MKFYPTVFMTVENLNFKSLASDHNAPDGIAICSKEELEKVDWEKTRTMYYDIC